MIKYKISIFNPTIHDFVEIHPQDMAYLECFEVCLIRDVKLGFFVKSVSISFPLKKS